MKQEFVAIEYQGKKRQNIKHVLKKEAVIGITTRQVRHKTTPAKDAPDIDVFNFAIHATGDVFNVDIHTTGGPISIEGIGADEKDKISKLIMDTMNPDLEA